MYRPVTGQAEQRGIVLSADTSGAALFCELLSRAAAEFPDTFGGLGIALDASSFKTRYPEILPRFEAARLHSPDGPAIARFLCLEAEAHLRFADRHGERSFGALWSEPSEPLSLVRVALPGPRLLSPSVDFRGRLYVGERLGALAKALDGERLGTRAAATALARVGALTTHPRGLSLAGERFVLFGAGAELSPVYTLLAAGAEVLWLDRESPPIDRLLEPRLGGVLHYVRGGVDLLHDPAAVRATVLAFAGDAPVHLGLYAFESGSARELRLGLTMNAIVRSLPPERVASISYLLSPMSVSPIEPEDAARADERRRAATKLQRALLRTGPLHPGHLDLRDARISCAVVAHQGASFQLDEYVGKRLAAEAFSWFGNTLEGDAEQAPPVSANMAPVTATRSLSTLLLAAAKLGAPSFDIVIAPPSTSRELSALLTIHDVLQPALVSGTATSIAARRQALFARQFHGGVHAQPYALDGLVRLAALRGLAHRPQLALELLR